MVVIDIKVYMSNVSQKHFADIIALIQLSNFLKPDVTYLAEWEADWCLPDVKADSLASLFIWSHAVQIDSVV